MSLDRRAINLGNWRQAPWSRYSFQHASEFVPVAMIRAKPGGIEPPVQGLGEWSRLEVADRAGRMRPLAAALGSGGHDALVILRDGAIAGEWIAPHCDPLAPHMIFSISKSVTGLLAGILIAEGRLSAADPVTAFVPEARGSAWDGVALRHVLDMACSLDFAEDYLDPSGAYDRYRRAMLWNPERPEDPAPDILSFLCTIGPGPEAPGTAYRYQTPNSEMAGVVLERAAGQRLHELIESRLWRPMGAMSDATITCDRLGTERAGGGMSCTTRDLARLGELVRTGGDGVLPEAFGRELWRGGDRAIWAGGDHADFFPRGSYHAYWYDTGEGERAAIGIHGQWLWIDPDRATVIALTSSLPLPTDDPSDFAIIAMMKAIARHG